MPGSVSKKITKKNKWRKYQSQDKGLRKVNLGVAALTLLISLILLGKLISAVANLGQPYSPDQGVKSDKKYSWDGTQTLNLVVKSKNIYTLSFNPVEQSVVVIKIPDETYVDVPFNFGRWPVRSLYKLGQDDSVPMGALLLEKTMSSVFGVPIEGYLLLSTKLADKPFEDVVEQIRQNPWEALSLIRTSKTDLSLPELVRLVGGLRGVRSDKVKVVDLAQSQITQWNLLPDSSRVLGIQQVRLDQFVQDKFEDSKLRDSGLTIGIVNATDHPGLAENAARMVTNMGGRVIYTTSAETRVSSTLVLGKPSYTTTRLVQVFNAGCLGQSSGLLSKLGLTGGAKKCSFDDPSLDLSRSDVVVVLGEDYYTSFNQKPQN